MGVDGNVGYLQAYLAFSAFLRELIKALNARVTRGPRGLPGEGQFYVPSPEPPSPQTPLHPRIPPYLGCGQRASYGVR